MVAAVALALGACSSGGGDGSGNDRADVATTTTARATATAREAAAAAPRTTTTTAHPKPPARPTGAALPSSTNPCAAVGIQVDGCADFGDIEVTADSNSITVTSPQGQRTYTPDQAVSEIGGKASGEGIAASLPDNVLFDFNSVGLRGPSREKLALVAGLAKRSPGAKVEISGFTDAVGSDDFNQRLSEARAGVVREALAILGVGRDRMSARGFGESRPVAPNTKPDGSDNPTGRAQNRRVEILLAGAHV
jgi:photosystem I P700 chlorophyll a apoprotein A2